MSELSPAAQAVKDAVLALYSDEKVQKFGWQLDVRTVAATLRAAADLLSAEVNAPKVDGSKYNGLWHSYDLLNAIADELESQ
jgi:hypothetical protein